jgi:hypothetical protein
MTEHDDVFVARLILASLEGAPNCGARSPDRSKYDGDTRDPLTWTGWAPSLTVMLPHDTAAIPSNTVFCSVPIVQLGGRSRTESA